MMSEIINVQLHLRYRIGIITRTRLLVSVLLQASNVPTHSRGASGECVKGGVVSKITLARSGARNKSMSSVVMRIVLPMMLGVLAGDVKALCGSSGRMMLLHAVQRARKVLQRPGLDHAQSGWQHWYASVSAAVSGFE